MKPKKGVIFSEKYKANEDRLFSVSVPVPFFKSKRAQALEPPKTAGFSYRASVWSTWSSRCPFYVSRKIAAKSLGREQRPHAKMVTNQKGHKQNCFTLSEIHNFFGRIQKLWFRHIARTYPPLPYHVNSLMSAQLSGVLWLPNHYPDIGSAKRKVDGCSYGGQIVHKWRNRTIQKGHRRNSLVFPEKHNIF